MTPISTHEPFLSKYPAVDWSRFAWLLRAGVPVQTLVALLPIRLAIGRRAGDRVFEDDTAGQPFLVFEESCDLVFWQPRTGEIATAYNRAFALGQDAIDDPATYSFDFALNVFADPLDWLRRGCDGCVILDWSRAFDRLRDVPRVALAERLLPIYRQHMKPARMPKLRVVPAADVEVAA